MKFLLKYWKVCFLVWLLIAIAIGCLVWNISEEPSDKIKNVIASISAFAVSSALLLNAVSIFQQSEMSFQQGQIKKFDETFVLISKWDDEHFLKARDYTRKQQDIHKDVGTQQILKEINNNEDLKRSIVMMTNYFELIETSIQNDRIYENIIMEHFAHLLKDIIDRYECFLKYQKDKGINPIGYEKLILLKKRAENFIENKKS